MAIPSSGPISLTDVQTEFGGANPIGINEYYAGGAYVPAGTSGTNGAVPTSGQIALSNFYGTANIIPYFLAFRQNTSYEVFNTVNTNLLSSGPYSTYKNGFFYTLGWQTNNSVRILSKYSSSGVLQWSKNLGNVLAQSAPIAAAIQVDSNNNVYFASYVNGTTNFALIKFDSSGTYSWGYVYNLAASSTTAYGINLHIDNANNIYYSASQSGFASVARITAAGSVGFCRTLSADAGNIFITSMTSSHDSSLLYIGCANGKIIALETTNGQNIVSTQLTQVGGALTVPVVITRSGTSNIIYALTTDLKLYKLNLSLTVQWARQLASTSLTRYGYPSIATNSTDGSVFAAFGVTQYPSSYIWSTQLYKYDTNGNLVFAREANPGIHYVGPTMFANMTTDDSNSLYFFGGYSSYTSSFVRPQASGWLGRLPLDGTGTGAYLTPLNGIQNTTVYYGNSPYGTSTMTGGNTTFTNVSTTATSTAGSGYTITATTSTDTFTTQSVSGTLTGGSALFTQPGSYTWIAPTGVTSVSAVAVGGGAGGAGYSISSGGGGGALAYANNITVTPGSSYNVGVGVGGAYGPVGSYGGGGGNSFFSSPVYANGGQPSGIGGTVSAGSGFRGGNGGGFVGGGGGAGGYTGIGGAGGGLNQGGGTGAGGAGGGGGGGSGGGSQIYEGGNAGAVGLGQAGQNGTGGPPGFPYAGYPGSSGGPWNTSFGGGGGAGGIETYCCYPYYGSGKAGGPGGVRIIWPGNTRSFPSTNTLVP